MTISEAPTATTAKQEQNTSPVETVTTSNELNELPIKLLRWSDRSRRAPVRYGTSARHFVLFV